MRVNQRHKISRRNTAFNQSKFGFTLIEIMIVLLIISIITTFAMIQFDDFLKSHRLATFAERFTLILKTAEQQAILQPGVFGLLVKSNDYMFYQMAVDPVTHVASWQSLSKDRVLGDHTIPRDITITLKIDEQRNIDKNDDNLPQTYFLPSGDITPFEITIKDKSSSKYYEITGKENGEITATAK